MFDFLTAQGRRDRFAERAMKRLGDLGWSHPMHYDAELFVLNLGGPAGRISLGDMFQNWSTFPRHDQADALDQALAFVFELGPPPPLDEARGMLVPTIRPRKLTEAMTLEPQDSGAALDGAWRPLGEHLAILVAINRPHSLMVVDAPILKGWGLSFDEALAVATANLRAQKPPVFERQEDGFYVSISEDRNELAWLLTPDIYTALALDGDPVVIPAAREELVIAGSNDIIALDTMARLTPLMLDKHTRPISFAPLVLLDGEWRPFVAVEGHYPVEALSAYQQAHDYEQQLPLILSRLRRLGRPEAVGQFSMFAADGVLQTLVLWTEPSGLLPRADFVVLHTGVGPTLVRSWQDVEAAIGGLPLEARTASPYHVVNGWPDAATLQKIAAAPEPAWAKERGIGVAHGRITMFG